MNYWDPEQMRQMTQLWLDMASKLGGTFANVQPGSPPPDAARQMRGAIFQAMSEQLDQFMRSEAFLEGMKESLNRTIQFQKQTQDVFTRMHHATQGVAVQDISAAMSMLRQMEDRLLDRLDELNGRLQKLEEAHAGSNGRGEAKGVHP